MGLAIGAISGLPKLPPMLNSVSTVIQTSIGFRSLIILAIIHIQVLSGIVKFRGALSVAMLGRPAGRPALPRSGLRIAAYTVRYGRFDARRFPWAAHAQLSPLSCRSQRGPLKCLGQRGSHRCSWMLHRQMFP